jgi:branched-chain amino acid aminotransferase
MRIDDLYEADEVFITSSVREIMPVARIGTREIGNGRPGAVYRRLHELFAPVIRRCR